MPERCEDDIEKKLKVKHAKILEMKQKESEERMAEHERLLQLEKDRYEKLQSELLERERLASILLSSRPRVTWRVDDATMQHSEGLSESTESAKREKSATSYLSEVVSVIIEAENLLDGCGAHPETIPNLIERIRRIEPFSPKFEDSISAEHFQLQVMAERTRLFLFSALIDRKQDWEDYKKTYEEIKKLFKENRKILDGITEGRYREDVVRRVVVDAIYNLKTIKSSISTFSELEDMFSGDDMDLSSFKCYDEYISHTQWNAFQNEFWDMKYKLGWYKEEFSNEIKQDRDLKQYAAEIKLKVDHVEELIGLFNQNQFATLSNTVDNALKSVEAEIENVEKKMKKWLLYHKLFSLDFYFNKIEGLRSKLKILKDEFAEALENQRKAPETEKPNQEKAILEMFSQLTPEDARNLSAKIQILYGATVAKPEEKVEIPNKGDMPTAELGQEDHVQEPDEPIDPNDLSVEENFQRLLAEQAKRHEEELEAKRRERAEKNRVEQEEIRAWASRLQNSKNQAGSKNNL